MVAPILWNVQLASVSANPAYDTEWSLKLIDQLLAGTLCGQVSYIQPDHIPFFDDRGVITVAVEEFFIDSLGSSHLLSQGVIDEVHLGGELQGHGLLDLLTFSQGGVNNKRLCTHARVMP